MTTSVLSIAISGITPADQGAMAPEVLQSQFIESRLKNRLDRMADSLSCRVGT